MHEELLKLCVKFLHAKLQRKCWAIFVFKKCFERHEDLRSFDVALLGPFSHRFGAAKQVGAQNGFGGVELLEDCIVNWV